jgi:hypothetical protein
MLLLGPLGWLGAWLFSHRADGPLQLIPRRLALRLKVFRRKTMW